MIKKKAKWTFTEPSLEEFWGRWAGKVRPAPEPPKKLITRTYWKSLLTLSDGDKIDNALLNDEHNFLLEDLQVNIDHTRGSEDYDCTIEVTLGKYITETVKNELYDQQMKEYESNLILYEKACTLHKLEVEEWKVWRAQEEKLFSDKKISDAILLLTAQGFKVTNE